MPSNKQSKNSTPELTPTLASVTNIAKLIEGGNYTKFTTFSGKEDIISWCNQFGVVENEVENEKLLKIAESKSKDIALNFIKIMVLNGVKTWTELKTKLITRFGKKKYSKEYEFSNLLVRERDERTGV